MALPKSKGIRYVTVFEQRFYYTRGSRTWGEDTVALKVGYEKEPHNVFKLIVRAAPGVPAVVTPKVIRSCIRGLFYQNGELAHLKDGSVVVVRRPDFKGTTLNYDTAEVLEQEWLENYPAPPHVQAYLEAKYQRKEDKDQE